MVFTAALLPCASLRPHPEGDAAGQRASGPWRTPYGAASGWRACPLFPPLLPPPPIVASHPTPRWLLTCCPSHSPPGPSWAWSPFCSSWCEGGRRALSFPLMAPQSWELRHTPHWAGVNLAARNLQDWQAYSSTDESSRKQPQTSVCVPHPKAPVSYPLSSCDSLSPPSYGVLQSMECLSAHRNRPECEPQTCRWPIGGVSVNGIIQRVGFHSNDVCHTPCCVCSGRLFLLMYIAFHHMECTTRSGRQNNGPPLSPDAHLQSLRPWRVNRVGVEAAGATKTLIPGGVNAPVTLWLMIAPMPQVFPSE